MKDFNLATYGVAELNAQEMEEVSGGRISILVLEGFLDGKKGNEAIYLFGIRIY